MRETRQQIKDRLQAAGRWEDFVAMREKLVQEGISPAQARLQALREIDSRLRPQLKAPGKNGTGKQSAVDDGGLRNGRWPEFNGQVPTADAVAWVGENMARPKLQPKDAPCGLAYSVWLWARHSPANETAFWTQIWARAALRPNERKPEQEEPKDAQDSGLSPELLDALRRHKG
jgi:hypothetical protein